MSTLKKDNKYNKTKNLIFQTLEINHSDNLVSKIFSIFIVILIILNVLAVILSSEKVLRDEYGNLFDYFELFSIIVFTMEFVLRLWTCTAYVEYKRPFWGRVKYLFSPLSIVDLLSILPFYIPVLVSVDLRFLRALRLFRIFRLFKIARYAKAIKTFKTVLLNKKEQLISTLFVISVLIVVSASILYMVENEAQPEAFSSIPRSMWWAVVTLTTVGYGDMYPITALGKFLASIILISSIGMFAVPAGIIASGFTHEELHERKNEDMTCPHCGKKIN